MLRHTFLLDQILWLRNSAVNHCRIISLASDKLAHLDSPMNGDDEDMGIGTEARWRWISLAKAKHHY